MDYFSNISKQEILNEEEILDLIDGIIRILTLTAVVHVLTYSIDKEGEFFGMQTLRKFLYMALGVVVYNLIMKKMFYKKIEKYINEKFSKN